MCAYFHSLFVCMDAMVRHVVHTCLEPTNPNAPPQARITYAPSMTMRWGDCDPATHTQARDKVRPKKRESLSEVCLCVCVLMMAFGISCVRFDARCIQFTHPLSPSTTTPDRLTHTYTLNIITKVCLAGGKMVALGYCEAAGLVPPMVERECCTSQEDIYDTVYNSVGVFVFLGCVWK